MPSILLLGSNSDVAVAIARKFAQNKYDVILAARGQEFSETLKTDLQIRYKVNAKVVQFDATDFSSHQNFYTQLGFTPDVTACIFGYLGDNEVAIKDWKETERIIQTNYVGAVSILNIIAEDYAAKQKGTIVGISSVAGIRGRQSNYIYGSAKAGFTAYLSGLRNKMYHSKVHVLTVLPGFINTKMTSELKLPKLLTAQPEDVADSVFTAVKKKKNIIYVKWFWRWIMFIIKNIPENIFKKKTL